MADERSPFLPRTVRRRAADCVQMLLDKIRHRNQKVALAALTVCMTLGCVLGGMYVKASETRAPPRAVGPLRVVRVVRLGDRA